MDWKEIIEAAQESELPYFCFDPEIVNLALVYDQFMLAAKCASVGYDFFVGDLWGCLDSGLL